VFEEEGGEGVAALWIGEADGPDVVLLRVVNGAGAHAAVGAHPEQIGEGLAGEDPLVVAEGLHFNVAGGLHGAGFVEPGKAGVEAVLDVDVDAGGGEDGVDGGVGEAPAADGGEQGAADDFVVGAGVPEGDAEFLEVAGGDVVVGPVDAGGLAVAFAAGEEFEAVFAFDFEAFELAHLAGEGGAEEVVFDIEGEAFAGGFQVRGVGGEFGVGVAVEDEIGMALMGADGSEEEKIGESGIGAEEFAGDLGGDLGEMGAIDAGEAEFAGERGGVGGGDAEGDFDGFGGAGDADGFIEREGLEELPGGGPGAPRGGKGGDGGFGGGEGSAGGLLDGLGLLDGVADGVCEGAGEAEILALPGGLEEFQLFVKGVSPFPISVLRHGFSTVSHPGGENSTILEKRCSNETGTEFN
jgi:hypothetical protein